MTLKEYVMEELNRLLPKEGINIRIVKRKVKPSAKPKLVVDNTKRED